eukprot:TRINITY_DN6920_c0_g1_i1.p1 TRINITY_DN6920_c0_g1~~TRINITY_DN6920_c0_g1_i1.p1  ORF type:complete len:405 (-),score=28.02 TRINITY_DN6920_c0_g1_i1:193-1368(-)
MKINVYFVLILLTDSCLAEYTRPCNEFGDLGFQCVHFKACDPRHDDPNWYKDFYNNNNQIQSEDETRFSEAQNGLCGKYSEVCCHRSLIIGIIPPVCGVRNENGLDRNVKAGPSSDLSYKFGEWPHVCIVFEKNADGGVIIRKEQRIPASLIGSNVLITAGHKASKLKNQVAVRCGDWDVKFKNETSRHKRVDVDRIIIHPEFNSRSLHNNYAIIITKEHFNYYDHIRPICLPEVDQSLDNLEECFASGWGKRRNSSEGLPTSQRSLQIKPLEHSECQNRFRKTRLGEFFKFDSSLLCGVGLSGSDVCEGDGGGPLVCKHFDKYIQIGITSWGLGCGSDAPGAYANLSRVLCWIEEQVSCYPDYKRKRIGLVGLSEESRRKCRLIQKNDCS